MGSSYQESTRKAAIGATVSQSLWSMDSRSTGINNEAKEYGKEKDNFTEYTCFYLKLFCVTGLHVKLMARETSRQVSC